MRLDLCMSFYKLPKANRKHGQILFNAMLLAQTAFVLRNPDHQNDQLAQIQTGVEGMLRAFEIARLRLPGRIRFPRTHASFTIHRRGN